jgi:hypothetical protein
MATHKVIQINSTGAMSEYSGKATSAGAGDSGEFPILDGAGKLDITMMPNGIGADSITATAAEALAAGDFVYITAGGTVMKADATTFAKRAMGYVLASVLNAGTATVFFDESNSALSGLTPGGMYYLSATAGLATLTAPTTATQYVQELGIATSATSLHVNIKTPILRA